MKKLGAMLIVTFMVLIGGCNGTEEVVVADPGINTGGPNVPIDFPWGGGIEKPPADDPDIPDPDVPEDCTGLYTIRDQDGMCVCIDNYEMSDSGSCVKEETNSVTSIHIKKTSLKNGVKDVAYEDAIEINRPRSLDYAWELEGNLPKGLQLDSDGSTYRLSGTPLEMGSFDFTVTACVVQEDQSDEDVCDSEELTLLITETLAINAINVAGEGPDICGEGCLSSQCKVHCALAGVREYFEGQADATLDAVDGRVDGEVFVERNGHIVLEVVGSAVEYEWNLLGNADGVELQTLPDAGSHKRQLVASRDVDLTNLTIEVTDEWGSSAELVFSSVEFRVSPEVISVSLGVPKERLMASKLMAPPVGYVVPEDNNDDDDDADNDDGLGGVLMECPERNEVVTGITYRTGLINDGPLAGACLLFGRYCLDVVKEVTLTCTDIKDLDNQNMSKTASITDGLWPYASPRQNIALPKPFLATGIYFGFGVASTASVVQVALSGISFDERFEDSELKYATSVSANANQYWPAGSGSAQCKPGEVLTGIRAHAGPWWNGYTIQGASHIICRKLNVERK